MDWKPITELRSVTRHMGSHICDTPHVTCYPTQVNAPHLNPSHAGRYSIYLPRRDGRLSWHGRLVIYRDGLPVRRQSPIQVVTTRERPDRELNPRPRDPKSNVLTVTLPSHQGLSVCLLIKSLAHPVTETSANLQRICSRLRAPVASSPSFCSSRAMTDAACAASRYFFSAMYRRNRCLGSFSNNTHICTSTNTTLPYQLCGSVV